MIQIALISFGAFLLLPPAAYAVAIILYLNGQEPGKIFVLIFLGLYLATATTAVSCALAELRRWAQERRRSCCHPPAH